MVDTSRSSATWPRLSLSVRYPSMASASRAACARSRPKAASRCSSIPFGIWMMTSIRLPFPLARIDLSTIGMKLPSRLDSHQVRRRVAGAEYPRGMGLGSAMIFTSQGRPCRCSDRINRLDQAFGQDRWSFVYARGHFHRRGVTRGGYTARALGTSIFTEADDWGELQANVRDAVNCHFDEDKAPKLIRLHFVREEVLTL